jgi:CheY-like chemotaxis protein
VTKRALIVDDSSTARQVLSNRLKKYGIAVDTLESAAAAIDYLYETAPDAIFMDYEMPGMDGFQALKVIKSNPKTAIIPVMMYTSKEGGLALSQARALGAVGVLPKQLEAQDLEGVLHSLHLMPEQDSLVHGFRDEELEGLGRSRRPDNIRPIRVPDRGNTGSVETVSLPMNDLDDTLTDNNFMRRWVRRELGQTEERLQISLERQFDELRGELYDLEASRSESSKPGRGQVLAILSLITGLCVMFYFLAISPWEAGLRKQEQINQKLLSSIATQDEKFDQISLSLNEGEVDNGTPSEVRDVPISLLEWAANQGTGFGYGELPFNDQRAIWLSELIDQLKGAGYRGAIELRAIYGNFCLQKNEAGGFVLAKPGLDISECQFSAELDANSDLRNDQSVSFANNFNYELSRSEGEIDLMLMVGGFGDPLIPYPSPYEAKTAGNWNLIAARNQRIKVNLYASK